MSRCDGAVHMGYLTEGIFHMDLNMDNVGYSHCRLSVSCDGKNKS